MARERASSGLPMMDDSLFVGPRIPDEIKRMIPHLTSIDKALFRKILQGRRSEISIHIRRSPSQTDNVWTQCLARNELCATLTQVHFNCLIKL